MVYYTELQLKEHSFTRKIGAIIFTELHVNMGHLAKENSAVNTRPF